MTDVAAGLVMSLEHVNVTAPEELIDEVVSWYEGCFGLSQVERPEGTAPAGVWFKVGDQEVHVSVDPHNPPQMAHFALVVRDFGEMVEHLRARGCHLEQASAIPGRHRCFTRDPAGNRIEIVAVDEPQATVRYEETTESAATVSYEEAGEV